MSIKKLAARLFSSTPDFKTYRELADYLKHTEPNSAARVKALVAGNEKGLLDTSRFGANVTIVSPVPDNADERKILDTVSVAQIQRRYKGADGRVVADGIGAFGGRGDKGETPIVAALREMLEEYIDAGHIAVPEGQSAGSFIRSRLESFLGENADCGILETGTDPEAIRTSIGLLRNKDATFAVNDNVSIDFKRFEYVPFDEAVDLSFPIGVSEGKNIGKSVDGQDIKFSFDTMQVTKPFQFIYQTMTAEEFQSCLTDNDARASVVNPDKEAACVAAYNLRHVITHNRAGQKGYDPETDPRYVHEGLVASYIAASMGVSTYKVAALQPDIKHQARLVGVNEGTLRGWVANPRMAEAAAWVQSVSVYTPY